MPGVCVCVLGEDGPAHMGLEDMAIFRAIPTATIFYPSDAVSAEKAVELAANTKVGMFCLQLWAVKQFACCLMPIQYIKLTQHTVFEHNKCSIELVFNRISVKIQFFN